MEVLVVPNTDEWLKERKGPKGIRVGSSEVGVACGVGGTAKPYSLYDKITGEMDGTWETDYEENPVTAHGHKGEPIIADYYEQVTGNRVEDANYWEHENKSMAILYGCSPDRKVYVNGVFEGILEIKAPYHIMYEDIKPEHLAQVMYQVCVRARLLFSFSLAYFCSDVDNQKTVVRLHGRQTRS